jgi:hypothetical protein
MLKRLDFSFSNDYQKLHLEVKVSEPDLIYKVHEAEGIDGLKATDEWKIYADDAIMWLKSFIDLRIFDWESSYSDPRTFGDSDAELPKWKLTVEEDDESELSTQKIVGLNSYPENFPDFLELVRKLLNLPYLVLEV